MLWTLALLTLFTYSDAQKVSIKGSPFIMGDGTSTKGSIQGSLPPQNVQIQDFEMDSTAVSNQEFEEFVKSTNYETDSEKFKWSFVIELHTTKEGLELAQGAVDAAKHWLAIPGASWRFPQGPGSEALSNHPVVHISYNDAKAYCAFRNGRLPTESEWEFAAR
jgi:sulfatase modifying factor 1